MRIQFRIAVLIFLVVLPSIGSTNGGSASDDWQPLFDGKSLTGWRASENAASWRVQNGAIVASGPRSHLYLTGQTFKNFEFEAEVMAKRGANSGIYFHTAFQDAGWPAKGFEVQINNTYAGDAQYQERRKTGSLYGIRNVYSALARDDEWFRVRIAVRGKQVTVRVKDEVTVDYTEATPPAVDGDYKDRVLSAGTFALQAHDPGSTVSFRKIRVRRLPDDLVTTTAAPAVDETYRELLRLGGANFPVVDYHTHLKLGLNLDGALKRWREQGIYAGIAVNGGLSFPVSNDAALDPFLAQLRGKPVFVAFQAEGREWVRLFSRRALAQFDYVFTDSMTWTDDSGKRMRLWIDNEVGTIPDAEKFMNTLVDRTLKILDTEPIDIYVNPTFLPKQLAPRYDELWTPDRMDKVVTGLAKNGIALEINNRYRLPGLGFIKRAKQAGVKFTCGTNNASADDLGRMEYCIEMIRACGLTWQDMWVPPADGRKAVQRRPLIPSEP